MSAIHQMMLFGGASTALALPYTMTFNQANKAAMIAAYAALGITVPPLLNGADTDPGVMLLVTQYGEDTGSGNIPFDSYLPGVKSPYVFVNSLSVAFPFDFTITLPPGTLARQVSYDLWRLSANTLQLVLTYDDLSTDTRGSPTPGASDTPFSTFSAFPTVPAVGKYITSITFRNQSTGTRWALDNLVILP